MPSDQDLTKYRTLVGEAVEAFRVDTSYAEEMAKQANLLRSRQESRREKTPPVGSQ